jgi:DNA-binding SARP family transcriptional activator
MEKRDRIEIRLLGRLHVRRSDGTIVDAKEWRTGKTVDLLRLLALEAGRPVRIDSVLDKLWPDVDEAHGRASLRTAASQIRRTLQADCIERQLGGLVLTNAWVDVVAYRSLAMEAQAMLRAHEYARVVALAREAESLYLKDFQAHDDGSCWAMEVRSELANMRQTVLADGAESAVKLRWMRDCIDLANRALAADPCFERPHRSLMQAHAALGETEQALRVFEHCRGMLAEELGADPSPQTRAVYMQILSGHLDAPESQVFVGRRSEVELLASTLDQALAQNSRELVCVTGPVGSGRDALIAEAAAKLEAECLLTVGAGHENLTWRQILDDVVALNKPSVVALPPIDDLGPRELGELATALCDLESVEPLAFVVPATPRTAQSLVRALAGTEVMASSVEAGALLHPDLRELAATLLSGPVAPTLVEALWNETQGLAGRAVATLRRWSAQGLVISTSGGLELVTSTVEVDVEPEVGTIIRRALEQLSALEMDIVSLVALIDSPVTPHMLLPLLVSEQEAGWDAAHIRELLDRLVDTGALRLSPQGYQFRHPHMRDATESWLRPTVRSQLHRRIAESGIVDGPAAATHWMKSGDPRAACDKALEAAELAVLSGDEPQASHQLTLAIQYAEALAGVPAQHAELLETLGDKAQELRLFARARQLYLSALAAAQLGNTQISARLRQKIQRTAMRDSLTPRAQETAAPTTVLEIAARRGWGAQLEQHLLHALGTVEPGRTVEIRFSAVDPSDHHTWTPQKNGGETVVRLVPLPSLPIDLSTGHKTAECDCGEANGESKVRSHRFAGDTPCATCASTIR